MEESAFSYQSFAIALMLLILAVLIIATARVPRPIGYLLMIGGAANFVAGWILGESGFAPQGAYPSYVVELVPLICAVYLLVVAWRMPRTGVERAPAVYSAMPEHA